MTSSCFRDTIAMPSQFAYWNLRGVSWPHVLNTYGEKIREVIKCLSWIYSVENVSKMYPYYLLYFPGFIWGCLCSTDPFRLLCSLWCVKIVGYTVGRRLFAHYTFSLLWLCIIIWKHWTYNMLLIFCVLYLAVCLHLSHFSFRIKCI